MTTSPTTNQIREYMFGVIGPNTDPLTDEINRTGLAEWAVDEFDDYDEDSGDIPERYFEIAHEVASEYEEGEEDLDA